jgi:uncharacterized lipoprotein YajG
MKKIMTIGMVACAMVAFAGCGKKEKAAPEAPAAPTMESVTKDATAVLKKADATVKDAVKDAPAVPEKPKDLPTK